MQILRWILSWSLALGLAAPAAGAPAGPPPRPSLSERLPPLSKAGIATLVVGTVLGSAGVVLTAREPTPTQADGSHVLDSRPGGVVLLALSGAMIVTGAILIGVGSARQRRALGRAALTPAGLVVRF